MWFPTSFECILKFAQRGDNDMCAFSFASGGEVSHVDVSVLAELFIHSSDLGRKLTHMSYNQDLWLDDCWIDSENGAHGEGTCLSRTILALRNQINKVSIDGFRDEWYRHCLDFGRFDKA